MLAPLKLQHQFQTAGLIKGFNLHLFLLLWLKKKLFIRRLRVLFFDFLFIWWRVWSRRNDTDCYLHEPPIHSSLLISSHFIFDSSEGPKAEAICLLRCEQTPAEAELPALSLIFRQRKWSMSTRERESQRNERIICSTHCSFKSRDVNNVLQSCSQTLLQCLDDQTYK